MKAFVSKVKVLLSVIALCIVAMGVNNIAHASSSFTNTAPSYSNVTIDEMRSNPERYVVLLSAGPNSLYGIDTSSVSLVRETPKYYVFDVNAFVVDYKKQIIGVLDEQYYMDKLGLGEVIYTLNYTNIYSFDGKHLAHIKKDNNLTRIRLNERHNSYYTANMAYILHFGTPYSKAWAMNYRPLVEIAKGIKNHTKVIVQPLP